MVSLYVKHLSIIPHLNVPNIIKNIVVLFINKDSIKMKVLQEVVLFL